MNCKEQCFGCHGLYDVDDDITNSRRSSLDALIVDPNVEELDISSTLYFTIVDYSCATVVSLYGEF